MEYDNQNLPELTNKERKTLNKVTSFYFSTVALWVSFLTITLAPSCPSNKSAEHYFSYGKKFEAEGDYENAVKYISKAIEVNPVYFEAYTERASLNHKRDSFHLSIQDYTVLLAFPEMTVPRKSELLYLRADSYYKSLNDSLACKDWDESCELNLTKSCNEYRKNCR